MTTSHEPIQLNTLFYIFKYFIWFIILCNILFHLFFNIFKPFNIVIKRSMKIYVLSVMERPLYTCCYSPTSHIQHLDKRSSSCRFYQIKNKTHQGNIRLLLNSQGRFLSLVPHNSFFFFFDIDVLGNANDGRKNHFGCYRKGTFTGQSVLLQIQNFSWHMYSVSLCTLVMYDYRYWCKFVNHVLVFFHYASKCIGFWAVLPCFICAEVHQASDSQKQTHKSAFQYT